MFELLIEPGEIRKYYFLPEILRPLAESRANPWNAIFQTT